MFASVRKNNLDRLIKFLTMFVEFFCTMYKGFNLETVEYKGINFTVWDIGGQEKVSSILFNLDSCL